MQSCTNAPLCTTATIYIDKFVRNLETVSDGLTAIFSPVLASHIEQEHVHTSTRVITRVQRYERQSIA